MPLTNRTTAIAYVMRATCASCADLGGYGTRRAPTSVCKRCIKAGHDGDEMYVLI